MADDNVQTHTHAHTHPHTVTPTHTAPTPAKAPLLNRSNLLFIAIVLLIFALTIYTRLSLVNYQGFYEPDGFYHFSVIRAAIGNNFIVPKTLGISGYPNHTQVGEPDGLYWVTLFPYYFLSFFGVSAYTVQRLVPLLFGLLDVIGAYFLARIISKDRVFNLLAMGLAALSSGDAARTSALIYRGDGFVTPFLIFALAFIGLILNEKDNKRKLTYMILSAVLLSLCSLVWNGASFADVIYILAFVLIMIYAFIVDKLELIENLGYVLGAIAIWFVLAYSYVLAGYTFPLLLVNLRLPPGTR